MGMFDFLKKDDEAEDGYDEDEEAYSSKRKKNDRGSSVRSIPAEESENADRMAGEAGSRFSTDYRSYLKMQSEQAKENLRKRTEAARAMISPDYHAPAAAPAEPADAAPVSADSPKENAPAPAEEDYDSGSDDDDEVSSSAHPLRHLFSGKNDEGDDDDYDELDSPKDDSDLQ